MTQLASIEMSKDTNFFVDIGDETLSQIQLRGQKNDSNDSRNVTALYDYGPEINAHSTFVNSPDQEIAHEFSDSARALLGNLVQKIHAVRY